MQLLSGKRSPYMNVENFSEGMFPNSNSCEKGGLRCLQLPELDIGNATTEVALARVNENSVEFISSSIAYTTGIKGTLQNVAGVRRALSLALEKAGWSRDDFKR